MSDIIDLQYIVNRDFKFNNRFYSDDNQIIELVNDLFQHFISFDEMNMHINQIASYKNTDTIPISKNKIELVIIDTCSFILNDINHFIDDSNKIYIITCGVFLEILQGCNLLTIQTGTFKKDLEKLCKLKKILDDNLIFLMLGRKMRAYWGGSQPSKSCRNCFNNDQPHHKILRDVDTEILRIVTMLNCSVDTLDTILIKRLNKIHRRIFFQSD
jgi:hypothetical protein